MYVFRGRFSHQLLVTEESIRNITIFGTDTGTFTECFHFQLLYISHSAAESDNLIIDLSLLIILVLRGTETLFALHH